MARAVLVERQRLLAPAQRSALVMVGAPSGFGKSVFAEQVLRRWGRPALRWRPSTLSERAAEGPDLVDGLRRAARRAGFVDLASTMLAPTATSSIESFADHVAGKELDLAIWIDDAHVLTDDALLLLDHLVEALPPSCRAVICHRPDRRVLRLGAFTGATVVDSADLTMRADEVALVVRRVTGVEPTATLVDDVERSTLGWPVAVNLAAVRLRDDPAWHPGFRSSGAKLLAGLVAHVVGDDPGAAARLAIPPLLDPTIVELLAGPGAWSRWEADGPPMAAAAPWWILPDAIRDAIRANAGGSARLTEVELRSIGQRYVDHGELAAAVDLFQAVDRPDLVVGVVGACHWTDLEAAGAERLARWIDLADRAEPVELAHFGLTLVRALESSQPALRDQLVERLLTIAEHGDLPAEAIRAIHAEDLRRRSAPGSARDVLREAEAALDATPRVETLTRGRLHLAAGHAASMLSLPADKDRAARYLRAAAELFGIERERRWQAAALARLGYNVLFHGGRFVEADAVLGDALSLLPSGDRARGYWLACHAEVQDHLGRRVDAIAAAREAVEIGERLRDRTVQATALWTLAWIHGHRGDLAALRDAMSAVESLAPAFLESYGGIDFYGSMVDHLVACGDVDGARRCLERVRSHPAADSYREAVRMAEARWEAVVGDPARALALLDELGEGVGTQRNADWVRLTEAAIAHARAGSLDAAAEATRAAFADCAALGVPDLPLRLERSLMERLDELLEGGVSAIAAASSLAHDTPPGLTERPADITVLGEFAVRRGALDVTPPDGLPATVVKIVCVRGPVHVESLIDEFWPAVDVETGRARLRNLLHRLRTRSGELLVRRGPSIALAEGVASDLSAFEEAAAEVDRADPHRRVALARRAVSLYGGPLLPGDPYLDWITAGRERLLRRYLGLLDLVAEGAEHAGSTDEAMEVLRRAVDLDPLDDARCVRAARVHLRHSRPGVARSLVERTVTELDHLGLPVSGDLRDLAWILAGGVDVANVDSSVSGRWPEI